MTDFFKSGSSGQNQAIGLVLLLVMLLPTACGTHARPQTFRPPQAGIWTLHYMGSCQGRDAEMLQITRLDESEIAFDSFRLLRDDDSVYRGSANFIAPMPADGRDIGYVISYELSPAGGGFTGDELVIEGGGHGLSCPVELRSLASEAP